MHWSHLLNQEELWRTDAGSWVIILPPSPKHPSHTFWVLVSRDTTWDLRTHGVAERHHLAASPCDALRQSQSQDSVNIKSSGPNHSCFWHFSPISYDFGIFFSHFIWFWHIFSHFILFHFGFYPHPFNHRKFQQPQGPACWWDWTCLALPPRNPSVWRLKASKKIRGKQTLSFLPSGKLT